MTKTMYTIDLKQFRKDNKMTQLDAAEYFGCGQGFISQIESGRRGVPEAYIKKILADNKYIANIEMSNEEPANNDTNCIASVPTIFVKLLFEERKLHDEKELLLIRQNQDLIDIIKKNI